ncbi:MAG: double-strand break repair protein AddB [Parvularculales bacterium]
MTATVFTIPSGVPFLDHLAYGLMINPKLGGCLKSDTHSLSDATILLPTRRAVRTLADAFLKSNKKRAMLLPSIRALGDLGEEDMALGEADSGVDDTVWAEIGITEILPPALAPLERQSLLTTLILQWSYTSEAGPQDAAQAAALAFELGRFLDSIHLQEANLKDLERLTPSDYAENWRQMMTFLSIITEQWPKILHTRNRLDPAARRVKTLKLLATHWQQHPPPHPVIAAGSTGSLPATAALLKIIAFMPQGVVVLPGLDTMMDDDSWDSIGPDHPQCSLKRLLEAMGVARTDVAPWPTASPESSVHRRVVLLSEAMKPAQATASWRNRLADNPPEDTEPPSNPLDGLEVIETPTPREEAVAIALMMRETLETPQRTATLVTPDRTLARRVGAELRRWNISVDDSAGYPLVNSPPFVFLRHTTALLEEEWAPVALLSLLKHPLAGLGIKRASVRRLTRRLERRILRGVRPATGIYGLRQAFNKIKNEREHTNLTLLINQLASCFEPLSNVRYEPNLTFSQWLHAHISTAEALAATDTETGTTLLWAGDAGQATAHFLKVALEQCTDIPPLSLNAYGRLLMELARPQVVRSVYNRHPRLSIQGVLESRLQTHDLVILGGLNEGIWPTTVNVDPWISRPMAEKLGLDPPEHRIGLAAHDFFEKAAAKQVVITRALKQGGTPTVKSRWLMRLEILLAGMGHEHALETPKPWSHYAHYLDQPDEPIRPIKPPAPTPPVAVRPTRISVTEVETLIYDPYSLYARYVLRLRALSPLDEPLNARHRGNAIHDVMEEFGRLFPDHLPENALEELIRIGERIFVETGISHSSVYAFWWPRFVQAMEWFAEGEAQRRQNTKHLAVEAKGDMEINVAGQVYHLHGRADQINIQENGALVIYDYKTGTIPSASQVIHRFRPQLPLEAAMARHGAFEHIPPHPTEELVYIKLSGGKTPGEEHPLRNRTRPIDANHLADETLQMLRILLEKYTNPNMPYASHIRPSSFLWHSDYDHLARVLEWSAGMEQDSPS